MHHIIPNKTIDLVKGHSRQEETHLISQNTIESDIANTDSVEENNLIKLVASDLNDRKITSGYSKKEERKNKTPKPMKTTDSKRNKMVVLYKTKNIDSK